MVMEMNTNTASVNIGIAGETRQLTIQIERQHDGRTWGAVRDTVACLIGKGTKVHRNNLSFVTFDSEAEAKKFGYFGRHIVTDTEGHVWGWSPRAIRNRNNVAVVGWADAFEGTDLGSKQNYYGGYDS